MLAIKTEQACGEHQAWVNEISFLKNANWTTQISLKKSRNMVTIRNRGSWYQLPGSGSLEPDLQGTG